MKKLRQKTSCQILAVIFTILFGTLTVLGGYLTLFTESMGLYTKSLETIIKAKAETVTEIYSIMAYKAFQNNNQEALKKLADTTSVEFGIISTSSTDDDPFQNSDLYYEEYYFNETLPDSAVSTATQFQKNEELSYVNRLIPSLHNRNIYHFPVEEYDLQNITPIKRFIYSSTLNAFYADDNTNLYLIDHLAVPFKYAVPKKGAKYLKSTDVWDTSDLVHAHFKWDSNTNKYVSETGYYQDLDTTNFRSFNAIFFDDYTAKPLNIAYQGNYFASKNIVTDHNISLKFYNGELNEDFRNSLDNKCGFISCFAEIKKNNAKQDKSYWVIMNRNEQRADINDLYKKQETVLTNLHQYRYVTPIFTILCFLLFILSLSFACYSAGYRENKEMKLRFWHKIPLLLFVILIGCILFGCIIAADFWIQVLYNGTYPTAFSSCCLITILILSMTIGTLSCINIAKRIRSKTLMRYTIYHYANNYVLQPIKQCIKTWLQLCIRHTGFMIKGGILFTGISFIEILALLIIPSVDTSFDDIFLIGLLIWILLKAFEIWFLYKIIKQVMQLQATGEKLASGELSHKTDTSHMFWEFKKHGNYLNQISDGIAIAVEERMKSERFKTELITNVSHDIKTPLTSIINYVDILQRENLTADDRREYLEILDRQSKRLKKLIEDLIEASKASTGNLSVTWESCDLDILLTQVVGEFEEKLSNRQLQLIIHKTELPVTLETDRRHLWRIFDNLMNNICKYSQTGTRVYINEEVHDNEVHIIFRNTSKDALYVSGEELLERFVRGDGSRNTEGSGLGLSIANSLTDLLKGDLEVVLDGDLFKVILRFPVS